MTQTSLSPEDTIVWKRIKLLKEAENFGYTLSKDEEKEYHRLGEMVSKLTRQVPPYKMIICNRCGGNGYLLVGSLEDKETCHRCSGSGRRIVRND